VSTPAPTYFGQPLTARETEIIRLVAAGQSNADIGRTLFLTENTVKTHLRRLSCKLGAADRAHAAILATRRRIVDPRTIQPVNTHRRAR